MRPLLAAFVFIMVVSFFIVLSGFVYPEEAYHVSAADSGKTLSVTYVYSSNCLYCEKALSAVKDTLESFQKDTGIPVEMRRVEINSPEGVNIAKRLGVNSVPSIVINDNSLIRFEDFGGNPDKLRSMLNEKLYSAAQGADRVSIERSIEKDSGNGVINVVTRITNNGDMPIDVSISGGFSENAKPLNGNSSWSGTLGPGEMKEISCCMEIKNGISYLPPQTVQYRDNSGYHTLIGPQTPVLIIKKISALTVLLAGIAAGINPCLIAIMVFIATTAMTSSGKHHNIIMRVVAFCSGLLLIYLLIGLGFFKLLRYAPSSESLIQAVLISILVALSLYAFYDAYETKKHGDRPSLFKGFLKVFRPFYDKFTLFANFILGGMFGLLKMPCVGGIYIAILGTLIDRGDLGSGITYLVIYNIGIIIPVLALGIILTLGLDPVKVDKFRHENRVKLKLFYGAVLLLLAVAFMFNIV
jgi:cytochrome c biogenesis protein CcdA/glutaredoxin